MKTDSKLQAKGDCNTLTTLVEEVRNLLSVHPPKTLASGSTDARKLLEPITKILQDVTAKEINLEVPVIPERFPRRALGYIPVWEQEDFEIGIFAFPPGAVIPLHDHPGMFVLSHVLYGSITVKSYDIDHETGETRRKETRLLKESESSLLFEHDRNIHEFTAGEDGCAVLDILAPPYDHDNGRGCTYYTAEETEMKTETGNKKSSIILRRCPQPQWFTTYRIPTKMDKVDETYLIKQLK